MSDKEITGWKVTPLGLKIYKEQKVKVGDLIEEYHDAFDLDDEIEPCPHLQVHNEAQHFLFANM